MKNLLYIVLLTAVFVSCDDRLEDLNTDKRNPAVVAAESLVATATRELVDNMVSMSVNDNPFRMYSQMWTETTYPEESQYNITTREISLGIWNNQYRDVLIDLQDAREITATQLAEGTSGESDATLSNRIAIIDIMMAYTYVTLVDIFGDIPYTNALDPANLNPSYDDAQTVYAAAAATLTTASTTLNANPTDGGWGSSDLVYSNDAVSWARFANSVKLRMAMKMADASGGTATSVTWADEAMAAGVITSNAQNFSLVYQGTSPNSSPLHEDLVLSGRADFVAAHTIIDMMNARNDPRRVVYFRENLGADTYTGGTYGAENIYGDATGVGNVFHAPKTPGVLFNYAEIRFLMAEMVERTGYTIVSPDAATTAEEHYNAGITASFEQWDDTYDNYIGDVDPDDADALKNAADVDLEASLATYLAEPEVAYTTATGDWRQKIGKQLWFGLYNQGLEAWSTWRRMDFDGFSLPPVAVPGFPVRMTYPKREATLNGDNYDAAGSKIGGDAITTKLFWDAN